MRTAHNWLTGTRGGHPCVACRRPAHTPDSTDVQGKDHAAGVPDFSVQTMNCIADMFSPAYHSQVHTTEKVVPAPSCFMICTWRRYPELRCSAAGQQWLPVWVTRVLPQLSQQQSASPRHTGAAPSRSASLLPCFKADALDQDVSLFRLL